MYVCVCVCLCVLCVCVCSGDAAVGKSSLCQMFRSDGAVFQKNYTMVRMTYIESLNTFSHLADAFILSYNWGIHEAIHLEEANRQS